MAAPALDLLRVTEDAETLDPPKAKAPTRTFPERFAASSVANVAPTLGVVAVPTED